MRKAIVTGANGFLGSALCRELAKKNVEVIAVIRNERSDISSITHIPGLRIEYCDLSELRRVSDIIVDENVDVFYHFAWEGSAGELRGNESIQMNNIKFSIDALRACAELGCRRFVFAGSIMEYEIQAAIENNKRIGINTLYCTAKLSADYMLNAIAEDLKITYIRGIISNIYGPGEKSPRLINSSIRKMLHGEHCSFSPAEQIYDFIYITDAARAFAAIGDNGIANRTYYIGSLNPHSLKDYLLEMRAQIDENSELGFGELPFDGVSLSYKEFDIYAVRDDTGFTPEVSFADGIKETARWMKEE